MDVFSLSHGQSVGHEVVLDRRIDLDDITALASHVHVENAFIHRDACRALSDAELVRPEEQTWNIH